MSLRILCGKICEKKDLENLFTSLQANRTQDFIIFAPKNLLNTITKPPHAHIILQDSTQAQIEHIDFLYLPDSAQIESAIKVQIPYFSDIKSPNPIKQILKAIKNLCEDMLDFTALCLAKILTKLSVIFKKSKNQKRKLAILRTDAIGDYLLFRNFLPYFYGRFGKITLIGNTAYSELALSFDKQYLEEFIPLDIRRFSRNPLYRFQSVYKIAHLEFETAINPIFSRDKTSEKITKIIRARQKYAPKGDLNNLNAKDYARFAKNYTLLTSCKEGVMFEFERNAEFATALLGKTIFPPLTLELGDYALQEFECFNLPKPYVVLFIGASASWRKWDIKKFYEVGLWHLSKGFHVVICGGKEDSQNGENLANMLNTQSDATKQTKGFRAFNLCGKTTLCALARVVYNGNHLVSNETSCAHLAATLRHDISIYVVSNGNHLYRFTPYPCRVRGKYYGIYHPIIDKNLCAYAFLSNYMQNPSRLDINQITSQRVIEVIENTLDS
ncbi:glycosyltransferase family 9 protein [Helicobacter himalayensis]|uniref:glycosyltransferase family 9 protein n=1 Tax=Helicobacter himalayensis TaxID=1591088 RepID=UPI00083201A6|nr:glycosyltransferase family 9 protein [Helicobacter himalayensis]